VQEEGRSSVQPRRDTQWGRRAGEAAACSSLQRVHLMVQSHVGEVLEELWEAHMGTAAEGWHLLGENSC